MNQFYFHGINCSQRTKTDKNVKYFIPSTQISQLPTLSEPNEGLNLDFTGFLDSGRGKSKYDFFML